MNNSIIKLLAAEGSQKGDFELFIVVLVFILFAILLFIYLASCIVIVKQGTRKIVERFGSYNRTLKEGIHIIFRPFDRIAPVPWNILSISERDRYDANIAKRRVPWFNDNEKAELRSSRRDLRRIDSARAAMYKKMDWDTHGALWNKLQKDIEVQYRSKALGGYSEFSSSDITSAFDGTTFKTGEMVLKTTGKELPEIMEDILSAENSLTELEIQYRSMGIDPYNADPSLIKELSERQHERDALAASVRYYPRHQDPHSRRAGMYAMAENHIQDFVDLRERHIDTSNQKVRKLFALKLDTDLHFPNVGAAKDSRLLSSSTRFSGVNLITKDNASIGANIVIFFSVTDPYLYYYGVDEPEESLVLLAITTLRNLVSGLTLEEALQARTTINKQIREELDIACNNWGIKANRVEVKEFELGYSMQKAMDDVLIAEREKRANILRAEGYRKMKDENVMKEHIKLKGYETLEEVSRGPANKVFIPNDLSDFITGAHVVADAFGEAKKEKQKEEKKAE